MLRGAGLRHQWLRCMYFCLLNIINLIYTQKRREIVSPPSQNTVGDSTQFTLLSGVPRNFFGGGGGFARNFFGGGVQQIKLST
jgi:hypothetical protein